MLNTDIFKYISGKGKTNLSICFYKKQNYSTQFSCTYRKSVPRTTAPKHIPAIPPIHQPTTLGTATSDTTFASRARVAVHLFEPFLKTFDRFCKKKFDGLMIYFSWKMNRICINYGAVAGAPAGMGIC